MRDLVDPQPPGASIRPDEWDWSGLAQVALAEARRIGGTRDAEDLAQTALLRAWRYRASCREATSRPGWVATIVRREATRAYMRSPDSPVPVSTEVPCPRPGPESSATGVDLRHALANLRTQDRTLIWLRYHADLSMQQLAAQLNTPEATARVRLHRARNQLRRSLWLYAPDEEEIGGPA